MNQAAIETLRETVDAAADFFAEIDENLWDGHQTARQVLAHLVFWHREYAKIISAAARHIKPELRSGKYRELNARADCEFKIVPMRVLVRDWKKFQRDLENSYAAIAPTRARLPFKAGSTARAPDEFCAAIHAHIRGHLARLKRAAHIEKTKRKK